MNTFTEVNVMMTLENIAEGKIIKVDGDMITFENGMTVTINKDDNGTMKSFWFSDGDSYSIGDLISVFHEYVIADESDVIEELIEKLQEENESVSHENSDETYHYFTIVNSDEFAFSGVARVNRVESDCGYYIQFKDDNADVYRGDGLLIL